MATLKALVPIAIMPGKNPLGTPWGISPELDKRIAQFYEAHGVLPAILLVPRELRPSEALSWSAYLALGEDLPGVPGCPAPAAIRLEAAQAIGAKSPDGGQEGITRQARAKKAPHRPRATTSLVDQEMASLGAQGLGAETIGKLLAARGVQVSERTIARRLAQARQGKSGL